MAIIRYEPLSVLNQLQKELGRVFPDFATGWPSAESTVETSHWQPQVDIKEEPNRFVVKADVPGVDPKAIEITMENHVLTIKGEKVFEKNEKHDNYSRKERFEGRFYRQFTLPDIANSENITANCSHGVLEVNIPKKEQAKPRKITIQANEGKAN